MNRVIVLCCALSAVLAFADDEAFEVTGAGKSVTHACKDKEAVELSGSGNTLTLTGACGHIEVSGSKNKVIAETISAVELSGVSNTVTYTATPDGKPPKVSKTGLKHSVTKVKAAE